MYPEIYFPEIYTYKNSFLKKLFKKLPHFLPANILAGEESPSSSSSSSLLLLLLLELLALAPTAM